MRVPRLTLALVACVVLAAPPSTLAQDGPGKVTVRMQGGPDVGQRAPDFSLPWANRDGVGPVESPYQLASDRGKTVVVAFYPRDFTKGCTAQMRTFAEQSVWAECGVGWNQYRFGDDPQPLCFQSRAPVSPAQRPGAAGVQAVRQQRPGGLQPPDHLRGGTRWQSQVSGPELQCAGPK
jgi:hypothetical protein